MQINAFVNIMKVYIERNNLQLELIRYNNMSISFTFTFAMRQLQRNIADLLGTEIFTGNARLFTRWQQVLMPLISERFEHKPVRSLSFMNGNREL